MPHFDNIETADLIEMLAKYTEQFTHLFSLYKGLNPPPEYLKCRNNIELILRELDTRKPKHAQIEEHGHTPVNQTGLYVIW